MTEKRTEKPVVIFSFVCALPVSFKINVSNIIFGLTVHLSFIWLLIIFLYKCRFFPMLFNL